MKTVLDAGQVRAVDRRVESFRGYAVGYFDDARDAIVAALGHDVDRAELAGRLLASRVPTQRDDPLRTDLLGGQHPAQADGTVTDDELPRLPASDRAADVFDLTAALVLHRGRTVEWL